MSWQEGITEDIKKLCFNAPSNAKDHLTMETGQVQPGTDWAKDIKLKMIMMMMMMMMT